MLFQSLALVSTAAFAAAQGVTSQITPTGSAPAGCTSSVDGTFEITIYDVSGGAKKRDVVEKRAECGGEGTLILTLQNGILKDNKDRVGYIASNDQFQFDGPVQSNAIYTAGWSVCGNTSLALGPSTNFYRCLSGSFYNLYDKNDAAQCELVAIGAVPCGSGTLPSQSVAISPSGGASAPAVTASADGQPEPTGAAAPVTQITDGQPQGASGAAPTPVTQITDGQIQAPSGVAATAPTVSQITDGQIQVPTASPAPAPPVVSQITDGQPQAPTGTGAPIPSAPAANGTVSAPSPPIATGAASFTTFSGLVAAVAGVVAVAML